MISAVVRVLQLAFSSGIFALITYTMVKNLQANLGIDVYSLVTWIISGLSLVWVFVRLALWSLFARSSSSFSTTVDVIMMLAWITATVLFGFSFNTSTCRIVFSQQTLLQSQDEVLWDFSSTQCKMYFAILAMACITVLLFFVLVLSTACFRARDKRLRESMNGPVIVHPHDYEGKNQSHEAPVAEYTTHNPAYYTRPAVHNAYLPPPVAISNNVSPKYRQDSSEYGDDEGYGQVIYEEPPFQNATGQNANYEVYGYAQ
jgi:hypothetical protein